MFTVAAGIGTALIQTHTDADILLDNGVFSCSYAFEAAKTLIIGDTDCAKAMTELYNLLAADRILATGGTYKAQKDGVSLTVAPSAPLAGAVFSERFFNELGNWLQAQTGVVFSGSMYPAIRPLAWLGTLAGLFAALLSGYLLASRTFLDGSYSVVFTARNHSGLFIAFRSVFWLISSMMAAVLTAVAFWLRLPLDPIGAAYVLYVLSASAVSAILCRAGLMPGVSGYRSA